MPPSRTTSKAFLLIALAFVAYLPALQNGFVWDDDAWLMNNYTLGDWNGLYRIWFDLLALQQYYPITGTAFWIQHALWRFDPLGYHVVNVLLHGLNAVLFALVLQRLRLPGAWFAAAIFAVHPVMVESVAWITEIKNLLSTTFFLGSIFAYLEFDDLSPQNAAREAPCHAKWLIFSLLLFVCALLTKTITCSLPAVLALLIWWKRERIRAADFHPLLPYFLIGLPFGLLTAWLEKHHLGAVGPAFQLEWFQRCIVAGRAVLFYFAKLIWPNNLTFIYPRWSLTSPWLLLFPLIVAALFCLLWHLRKSIGKGPFVAAACFFVTLTPLLGFFDGYAMQFSFVADHWQYLSSLAILTLAAVLPGFFGSLGIPLRNAILGSLLAGLALLTMRQCFIYENTETLWRDTIAKNPHCWLAHNNLGVALNERSAPAEAEEHFRTATQLNTHYYDAENNLGESLLARDQIEEAAQHIDRAIAINPGYAAAHWNKALILAHQGKINESYEIVAEGLQQRPLNLAGINDFAWLLATSPNEHIRDPTKAERLARQCCEATKYLYPRFLDTLAATYASQNRFEDAIDTAGLAANRAVALGQINLARDITRRLELYRSGQGYLSAQAR